MAKFDLTSTGKILALIIIVLLSLTLSIAPIFAPDKFALPPQAAGIVGCFARGALVPMLWDMKPYILLEFAVAFISVMYVIIKYCKLPVLFIQARTNDSLVGPTQTPLSFPNLWFIAAPISFISFEGLFFLVVGSSKELGFYGRFDVLLWTLLKNFGLGIVDDKGDSGHALWIRECGNLQGGSAIEFGEGRVSSRWSLESVLLEIMSSEIVPLRIAPLEIVL